jgi:hypothetical protein
MSTRNAFYEELERYGFDTLAISKVEIEKGSTLLVYIHNKPVPIDDPSLVKLAKLATLNVPLDSELSREQLLKRLYGIATVFEGMTTPFSKFVIRNTHLPTKKIAEKLEDLEKRYLAGELSKIYQEGLKIRICKKLTYKHGISFKDFEEIMEESYPTTENLLNVLATLYL